MSKGSKIRKAVFPVAGIGTRFLPATKANPKEMLPIVDKPLIQYAVEDAIAAGITELIFVTSYSKRSIEDHFDSNFELETRLKEKGKLDLLQQVKNILPKGITCVYIRQAEPLGLGHAVLCAKEVVGDEPFVVLLADDLIDAPNKTSMQQMVEVYEKTKCSVLAVQEVAREETQRYGVVDLKGAHLGNTAQKIYGVVEKPEPSRAPSCYGVVGRYVLTPEIFSVLEATQPGAQGEIQLTDAISQLVPQGVYAYQFQGTRYDCGSKLGYLQATVNFALKHTEISDEFRAFLKTVQ
jgi:UTP--glucose-1-phosphate uridylyltransferase